MNSYQEKRPTLDDKIEGCLVGAAAGARIGFARVVEPERFKAGKPAEMFKVDLRAITKYKPTPNAISIRDTLPLIDVGVRAFLESGGRVTPEQFAELFRNDEGIAYPAFWWDGLHTVQEILREGMNPRISGLGTYPNGLMCAAMPAVGIFHCAHPDYAYLDGVELASVAQTRIGADWAGLCAAAIAAAFDSNATGERIVETVMKIAFQHNKDLFYELDYSLGRAKCADENAFLNAWHHTGGAMSAARENTWIAHNPLNYILPALRRYDKAPYKMMALLVVPPTPMYVCTVSAAIGGAIAGAMHGSKAFPQSWVKLATPAARPWFKLAEVVNRRIRKEAQVIRVTEKLAELPAIGKSLLREKVRGCILAGAIGNAMGSPVEGMMYQAIDKKYPKGITTILDPSRLESEDDNQMAMLLVETYIAREGAPVMARHFGKTWQDKLNRDHFFVFCMGRAYDLIRREWDPRITGHWSVVTGSTVMCMEPVGIYHIGDPEYAAIDAKAISYMYQRGLDMVAATMLAATVAEAFKPEATVESVCDAALAAAPREKMLTFDKRPFKSCRDYIEKCLEIAGKYTDVLAARKELYQKCLLYHMIDPLELWGFSLAMFKIAKGDVRQAAIGGTNIGRDSDTIAGRAAMLSGILRGASNVPREWASMFSKESLDKIDRNAERLADLVMKCKLPVLKKRQNIGGENR
ncbi:MAG: ADP-ribosylglycohydrolase family protein [Kiritimatiellae bacterium]|nr:ADP-ribosylglycohydrolase family protein [Kiritimatiellia bacterium]